MAFPVHGSPPPPPPHVPTHLPSLSTSASIWAISDLLTLSPSNWRRAGGKGASVRAGGLRYIAVQACVFCHSSSCHPSLIHAHLITTQPRRHLERGAQLLRVDGARAIGVHELKALCQLLALQLSQAWAQQLCAAGGG